MRQFGSASPTGRVDIRKKVLQIDSGTDGNDGSENSAEDRAIGIVRMGFVRVQKASAIEIQPAQSRSTTDEADCVRSIAEFRSSLRQVFRSTFDVPPWRLPTPLSRTQDPLDVILVADQRRET